MKVYSHGLYYPVNHHIIPNWNNNIKIDYHFNIIKWTLYELFICCNWFILFYDHLACWVTLSQRTSKSIDWSPKNQQENNKKKCQHNYKYWLNIKTRNQRKNNKSNCNYKFKSKNIDRVPQTRNQGENNNSKWKGN